VKFIKKRNALSPDLLGLRWAYPRWFRRSRFCWRKNAM